MQENLTGQRQIFDRLSRSYLILIPYCQKEGTVVVPLSVQSTHIGVLYKYPPGMGVVGISVNGGLIRVF
jgi:hypothetical protein